MTLEKPIRSVTTPGKLVLLGEYAVLDGAPALVAAIDRGVTCSVYGSETVEIARDGDARFVTAALQNVEAPPGRYLFADFRPVEPPLADGAKPGFGGSAAATVAAVIAAQPDWSRERVFQASLSIHRSVQGSGSGVDIAASVYGGLLRYSYGELTSVARRPPLVAVWSGRSAATGPRVEQYLSFSERKSFAEASSHLVDDFARDPVDAVRHAYRLLQTMTRRAGIDWETPAHVKITSLAEDCGGAAKPSGAGGGDCAVAVFPNSNSCDAFLVACREQRLNVIDVDYAFPRIQRGTP